MLFYYNINVKPHRRDADPDSVVRVSVPSVWFYIYVIVKPHRRDADPDSVVRESFLEKESYKLRPEGKAKGA